MDDDIQHTLEKLRLEHRDLDAIIKVLIESNHDEMRIQRLKKKKLMLRDRIVQLENMLASQQGNIA